MQTHQINQNVPVMCCRAAQLSDAAGQEPSAHTPPGQMGLSRARRPSGEEAEDYSHKNVVLLYLSAERKSSVLLSTLIWTGN